MRLLQHTTISDAAEELLIAKMKIELGTQHVAKYLQMGADMKSSKEQTEAFHAKEHGGVVSGVELQVKVLTSGLWGTALNVQCKLPDVLKGCCEKFEEYYKNVHTGRHLVWNASLGDCEIKTNCFAKPYTFISTVYQAAILSFFNGQDVFTFQQLTDETKLGAETLSRQLLNLTNPKMGKLLIKENLKTPKFTPEEKITINKQFASASLRMSLIPVVVRKVKVGIIGGRKTWRSTSKRSPKSRKKSTSCGPRSSKR